MQRPIRKDDRVEANYRGSMVYGVVQSVRAGKAKVILDGGKSSLTGAVGSFRLSNHPLPADARPIVSFNKGDRVECNVKGGGVLYGVIEKGGAGKLKMVVDGGKEEVRGPASIFRLSDKPLARDTIASPMDRYAVTRYKKLPGHGDCESFEAEISFDGKPLLRAYNSGHGGCNEIRGLKRDTPRSAEMDFSAAGKAWAAANGAPNLFEAADTWIHWYIYQRPYGVTSDVYLKEFTNFGSLKA